MRIDVPASAGGGGTVTSVTGATPIASSGGNTPAISLDSTGVAAMIAYGADTGTANNIAVTVPSWWPAAAVAGMAIRTKANASSTGATQIVITPSGGSAYAAANVMKRTTAGVAALGASGDYVSGGMYEMMFDGTQWVLATTSSTVYTGGALTATGILSGNSNNQLQGCSTFNFTAATGVVSKYNNASTAGQGLVPIFSVTSQKAETASADANVLTYTPGAATGTLRINVVISVSSATSGVIAWTLSWTDSNGNAQSNIQMPLFQQGTAAPALSFTTSAAGNYWGSAVIDINNAQGSIVVKWVGGGTTAAKMTATVEKLI